ncbi:MAG: GGDEF domain-containing protein [Lachnospiraceae bacterium]|nr:GGDEF domain-containing protein [Lachnospiraceae bacterium]
MKNARFFVLGIIVALYVMTLGILLKYSDKSVMPITTIKKVNINIDGVDYADAIGGEYLVNKSLKLKKGEVLEVSFLMPYTDSLMLTAMDLYTNECSYEISVDDNKIAEFYKNKLARGSYIGSDYQIVSIPEDMAGKTVKIRLRTSSSSVSDPVTDIHIGNRLDLYKRYIFSKAMPLFMGIFLFIYGGIFLIISLILNGWVDELKSNLLASAICVDLALFLHTYYRCIRVYSDTQYEKSLMYSSMTILFPLIIAFAFEVSKGVLYEKRNNFIIASLIVIAALNACHYFGMISFNLTKYIVYLVLLIVVVFVSVKFVIDLRKKQLDSTAKIQMIGLVILCVLMYASSLMGLLSRLLKGDSDSVIFYISSNLICVGALLFAYYQMVNFYINVTGAHARTREFESLAYLAYADGLTGLYNRSKLNQQLEEWEANEDNYCIISLDLNGLKTVNDNYGHNAGDELLKVFGKALKDVFEEEGGMVGRIGGDEFMVIMRRVGTEEVEQALRMLDAKLEVINTVKDVPWDYSTAYGYGFRVECSEDFIHQTYLLADQRMYEAKKEHHKRYRIAPR